MKKHLIIPYHGHSNKLVVELDKVPMISYVGNNNWEFRGTLDEFVENWGKIVMIIPDVTKTYTSLIYVTQHNSFSAR